MPNPSAFSNLFPSLVRRVLVPGLFTAVLLEPSLGRAAASAVTTTAAAPLVWTLDDLKRVGGETPVVQGAPKPGHEPSGAGALVFDGKGDGLLLPVNPLAGLSQFTIEILFSPAADGGPEQRFFHAQDDSGRRVLMELRLNREGGWWFDTFLKPATIPGLTLIDPKKVHPAGHWYWVALRFDGRHMTSFVNGEKELEGEVAFEAMGRGQTSLGVRMNHVSWFKGTIGEVRIHPVAVEPGQLQRLRVLESAR